MIGGIGGGDGAHHTSPAHSHVPDAKRTSPSSLSLSSPNTAAALARGGGAAAAAPAFFGMMSPYLAERVRGETRQRTVQPTLKLQ